MFSGRGRGGLAKNLKNLRIFKKIRKNLKIVTHKNGKNLNFFPQMAAYVSRLCSKCDLICPEEREAAVEAIIVVLKNSGPLAVY